MISFREFIQKKGYFFCQATWPKERFQFVTLELIFFYFFIYCDIIFLGFFFSCILDVSARIIVGDCKLDFGFLDVGLWFSPPFFKSGFPFSVSSSFAGIMDRYRFRDGQEYGKLPIFDNLKC